jgi:hypothetical protein
LDFKYTITTEPKKVNVNIPGNITRHVDVVYTITLENVEQHVLFTALFVDALKNKAGNIPGMSEDDVRDFYDSDGTRVVLKDDLFCGLKGRTQGIFLRCARTFHEGELGVDKSDLIDLDD